VWSPLHCILENGHVEPVLFPIEHGTDPMAQVKCGRTHLHLASQNRHMHVTQFLVDCGADVVAQDMDGMASLCSVLGNGHVQAIQPNLRHSAAQTKVGELQLASHKGHFVSHAVPCRVMSRMSPHRARHRCDSPCQARMNSVALSSRQEHVCVSRFLVRTTV